MNLLKLLTTAGVPESLHAQAIACLREANKLSDGLAWAKWKVRLFKAGKIARLLPWSAERLIDLLFFWQGPDHCRNAYVKEFERKNYPTEYHPPNEPCFTSRNTPNS